MFPQIPLLLVVSFGFTVSATTSQPTEDSALKLSAIPNIVEPIFPSNASVPTSNASAENGFTIRCDGEAYGYNPNILDCEDAKEYLLPDASTWTFGERHTGLPADILPLPYLVMGDRGLCYVQAILIGDHTTAKASLNMLRRAAAALVVQCATSVVSQGGIATNIGGDNNLAIILGAYEMPVTCRGTLATWESCRDVLYDMPADKVRRVFGPGSDPAVTEDLPYNIDSSDLKCSANIFSAGKSDVSSFYDIWKAVTALFSVCARHGKAGSVRGLGEHGDVFLTMTASGRLELPSNSSRGFSS
ncbi:hypothetical protein HO173_003851 [Letharia columbiana]|uniref:Ecp2 effector protein domain-containing protein n=1 Tax=Letharia columbiana TaxID=112416 RepID=A0A8H6FZ65_9LECA|nr:uncharacterized protein HO173_003851 [Letharia columbiana]KAF6237650.1 hypothetical protein HO173_003851 [Letharia columbiana]